LTCETVDNTYIDKRHAGRLRLSRTHIVHNPKITEALEMSHDNLFRSLILNFMPDALGDGDVVFVIEQVVLYTAHSISTQQSSPQGIGSFAAPVGGN